MGEVVDKAWNLTPVIWFIQGQKDLKNDKKYNSIILAQRLAPLQGRDV